MDSKRSRTESNESEAGKESDAESLPAELPTHVEACWALLYLLALMHVDAIIHARSLMQTKPLVPLGWSYKN